MTSPLPPPGRADRATKRAVSRHPAVARIDLSRLRDNYRALRLHAGPRAVIPVLKANAYGHGAAASAKALEALSPAMIAVAYVDEAVSLRQAGVTAPLLVLTGFAPEQVDDLFTFDLTPVVSTPEQVAVLANLPEDARRGRLSIHVKADTGMSRLGFPLRDLEPAVHRLEDSEQVEIDGLMTHLSAADEDAGETERQLDAFDEAVFRLQTLGVRPGLIHAANSAGLAFVRDTHTAVRPGLLLYGVKPQPLGPLIDVQPVMEVRARVSLVKDIPPRARVSYGGHYVAGAEGARIATVNAGYADGLPRTNAMREGGFVRFRGQTLKVAGTVCMDLTMLDASGDRTLRAGDEVTILGDSPDAWTVASWAGTNAWQALTAIGPRVPRRYFLDGREVGDDLAPLA